MADTSSPRRRRLATVLCVLVAIAIAPIVIVALIARSKETRR